MSGDTRQITLRLSKAGHKQLDALLRQHCTLYNAALEERFTAWKSHKANIAFAHQARQLTLVRRDDPAWSGQDRRLAIETLKRADKAYRNWFRRMTAGLKGGRPRFKSELRFRTLEIYSGANRYLTINDAGTKGIIAIKGLPSMRFRMPQKPLLAGQPLTIRITRTPCRVTASLIYDIETPELPTGQPARPAGIDMGVANTLTTQDSPLDAAPPRSDKNTQKRIRKLQRRMARQRDRALKEGRAEWRPTSGGRVRFWWLTRSRRYQKTQEALQRVQERQRLSQRNWQHRITSEIVKDYDFIAVEDLQIQNMTASASGTAEEPGRNVAQKRGLNRSILEQGWGGILAQLEYKAERAGVRFVGVPPQGTSRECPKCHLIEADNRRSQAVFRCVDCGYAAHADVNAAGNILRRGLDISGLAESLPMVAAGAGVRSRQITESAGAGATETQHSRYVHLPGFT